MSGARIVTRVLIPRFTHHVGLNLTPGGRPATAARTVTVEPLQKTPIYKHGFTVPHPRHPNPRVSGDLANLAPPVLPTRPGTQDQGVDPPSMVSAVSCFDINLLIPYSCSFFGGFRFISFLSAPCCSRFVRCVVL
jgi:hypothetical protein